jgi:hypothetical protein
MLQAVLLDQVTARLSDGPVEDLVADAAGFARRNPLLVLGGAALAGFAAARIVKSAGVSSNTQNDPADPWSGHLSRTEDAA